MSTYSSITFLRPSKELIQAKTYEPVILEFMNNSKCVFPETYSHIEEQSHGEPDFEAVESKTKYDAKLLFSTEQCDYLGKGDKELISWYKSVIKDLEQAEHASENSKEENRRKLQNTCLYNEMLRRLPKEETQENTIYFTPFPIVIDLYDSIFAQLATDIIDEIYDALVEQNPEKFINKTNFIIYPTSDGRRIVLRKLGSHIREYSSIHPLQKYIDYHMFTDPNLDADIIFYK